MRYYIYIFRKKKMKSFYRDAIAEYEKRLSRYCRISYKIVKKEKEWDKLICETNQGVIIVPGPADMQLSSEKLSERIGEMERHGISDVSVFISDEDRVSEDSEKLKKLSVSCFSCDACMAGMIVFEQIYRAYRILHNHPYHK